MTVKEVLKLAAEMLGRQDLSEAIDGLEGDPEGEIKSLVRCFQLVENEVALDYFPLKKEESFAPVAQTVAYTRFSSAPVNVHNVTDREGRAVEFELRPTHVLLRGEYGSVTVTYSYAPAQKTIEDESEFSGKISSRLLAFGVAGEFCLASARYQEAAMWEKRFRDAIRAANLNRRRLSVRSRRWV